LIVAREFAHAAPREDRSVKASDSLKRFLEAKAAGEPWVTEVLARLDQVNRDAEKRLAVESGRRAARKDELLAALRTAHSRREELRIRRLLLDLVEGLPVPRGSV
jgi:hypothetical protein